ncbi:gtpase era [Stylonychia lemnae]|uniref:Gtpase era n=1 Tax=Stylonychia lemnae TaxID=5949 RepID=A0A078AG89_STYLE|nr:gtpase era [Stylonychia lemnae]|eukprot:CDW81315.1 gtpase era [Stylonychia lemnae]
MALILLNFRKFSQVSRIVKYASKKQKDTLYKREKNENENKLYDGYNSQNTDFLEIRRPKPETLELKPVQHPINLYEKDANIVSYKVPPKNLTPYYQVPMEALAMLNMGKFESPLGAKTNEICIIGAPNAGKSSILNYITERDISAVSNKYNTTDEAIIGVYTDIESKVQLAMTDTPGITKASDSMRSKLLVTKAWDKLEENDMVMFVVDSAKKLDFEVKQSIQRLKEIQIDPQHQKILDALLDDSFTEQKYKEGFYEMNDQEKAFQTYNLPSVLVLNKVDLITNKQKLRDLQNELEDLGNFEKIFHVSAQTGFGMDQLRNYLMSKAKDKPWQYHPEQKSKQSEVDKVEESMKQAIFEKFFKEIPYQIGIKCTGWVPKLNGELRVDIALDVKNDIQKGMLLGERGRIIKDVRERATQILIEKIQRPVSMFVEIKVRRNSIDVQNKFDKMEGVIQKKQKPSLTSEIKPIPLQQQQQQ